MLSHVNLTTNFPSPVTEQHTMTLTKLIVLLTGLILSSKADWASEDTSSGKVAQSSPLKSQLQSSTPPETSTPAPLPQLQRDSLNEALNVILEKDRTQDLINAAKARESENWYSGKNVLQLFIRFPKTGGIMGALAVGLLALHRKDLKKTLTAWISWTMGMALLITASVMIFEIVREPLVEWMSEIVREAPDIVIPMGKGNDLRFHPASVVTVLIIVGTCMVRNAYTGIRERVIVNDISGQQNNVTSEEKKSQSIVTVLYWVGDQLNGLLGGKGNHSPAQGSVRTQELNVPSRGKRLEGPNGNKCGIPTGQRTTSEPRIPTSLDVLPPTTRTNGSSSASSSSKSSESARKGARIVRPIEPLHSSFIPSIHAPAISPSGTPAFAVDAHVNVAGVPLADHEALIRDVQWLHNSIQRNPLTSVSRLPQYLINLAECVDEDEYVDEYAEIQDFSVLDDINNALRVFDPAFEILVCCLGVGKTTAETADLIVAVQQLGSRTQEQIDAEEADRYKAMHPNATMAQILKHLSDTQNSRKKLPFLKSPLPQGMIDNAALTTYALHQWFRDGTPREKEVQRVLSQEFVPVHIKTQLCNEVRQWLQKRRDEVWAEYQKRFKGDTPKCNKCGMFVKGDMREHRCLRSTTDRRNRDGVPFVEEKIVTIDKNNRVKEHKTLMPDLNKMVKTFQKHAPTQAIDEIDVSKPNALDDLFKHLPIDHEEEEGEVRDHRMSGTSLQPRGNMVPLTPRNQTPNYNQLFNPNPSASNSSQQYNRNNARNDAIWGKGQEYGMSQAELDSDIEDDIPELSRWIELRKQCDEAIRQARQDSETRLKRNAEGKSSHAGLPLSTISEAPLLDRTPRSTTAPRPTA